MNYIDLILEEAEDYLYNEGTNFDLMTIKRDHIKPIKEKLRRVKILVKNGDMVNPYRAKVYNIIDEKIELCQKIIQNIRSGAAYNKLEK